MGKEDPMREYMERIKRQSPDDVVIGLFAQCAWLPPYYAAVPCAFMLVRIFKDKGLRQRMWKVPFLKPLIGFSLLFLVQSLLYGDRLSKGFGAAFVVGMTAMVYLRVSLTPKMLRFMLRSVLWGTFASLAFAMTQVLRYDFMGGYRPDSWYFNPNVYSMVSGFILVCALYQWIKRMAPKPLILCAMASCLLGLFLSGSRAGMASAALGLLILILSMQSKKGALYFLIGAAALAGVLVLVFPEWLRLNDPKSTFGVRTDLWKAAAYCIKQRPLFGYGGWTFGDVYPKYGFSFRGEVHSHNLFLELLLSCGVVGTILLLIYVYGNVKDIVRLHKSGGGRGFLPLALAILCMVLFHGMLDMTLFSPPDGVTMFFMLSIAGWLRMDKDKDPKDPAMSALAKQEEQELEPTG